MNRPKWVICPEEDFVPVRKKTLTNGKVVYINRNTGEQIKDDNN